MAGSTIQFDGFVDMQLSQRKRRIRAKSGLPGVTKASLPLCSGLRYRCTCVIWSSNAINTSDTTFLVIAVVRIRRFRKSQSAMSTCEELPRPRRVFVKLKLHSGHSLSRMKMCGSLVDHTRGSKWDSNDTSSSHADPSLFNCDPRPFLMSKYSSILGFFDQSFGSSGHPSHFSGQCLRFCSDESTEREIPLYLSQTFTETPYITMAELSQQSDLFNPYPPSVLDSSSPEKPAYLEAFES
ncbi:unnamed protein product [Toxocara canis]|nr:unnamed protein product [Toxocara canis]